MKITDIIIQLFSACIGSLGFSLIFNSEKKNLFPASMGGLLGWSVYLLCSHFKLGVFISSIGAAIFCQIYSEVMARIQKSPTTVFIIPAIIPLVPGSGLYYTMYYASLSDWENFRKYGTDTLLTAFGIAVGVSFVSAVLLLIPKKKKAEIDK